MNRTNAAAQKLFAELSYAISATNQKDLREWGTKAAKRVPAIGARRLKNFAALLKDMGLLIGKEFRNAAQAQREGALAQHLRQRGIDASKASIALGGQIVSCAKTCFYLLREDPKTHAPGFLALALGFVVGSGGPDANGGIPDTDISLFGIGEHRSILTHSILAGILVEGAILAISDLVQLTYDKLPEVHQPFWDTINAANADFSQKLALGMSAGIAYHLAIDGTLQEAPYKDLPVSMPMEAHQSLFLLNAAVEGNDALTRGKTTEPSRNISNIVSNGGRKMLTEIQSLWKKEAQ
jgi:hypothetical protein